MITAHALYIWPTIGAKMGPRIGKQCHERYLYHLSPQIRHGPWSAKEDAGSEQLDTGTTNMYMNVR